jgi:hypothetical protein
MDTQNSLSEAVSFHFERMHSNQQAFIIVLFIGGMMFLGFFIGVVAYLQYQKCQIRTNEKMLENLETDEFSYTRIPNKDYFKKIDFLETSGFLPNNILMNLTDPNHSIQEQIMNKHDDFEFCEIRSEIANFCKDMDNQIRWGSEITENVFQIKPKKRLQKPQVNVRRSLLPEFEKCLNEKIICL